MLFQKKGEINLSLYSSGRVSDLTPIKRKPENPASRSLFFLPRKSQPLLLQFKAFSPGVFGNSAPFRLSAGMASPLFSLSPENLEGLELLLICSPSCQSPVSVPQPGQCQDLFLEEGLCRSDLQLHTERGNCQPKAAQSVHHTHLQLLPNLLASFPTNSRVFPCTINQVSYRF